MKGLIVNESSEWAIKQIPGQYKPKEDPIMKTAGIEREEVLLMLSELNDQLNMLESELHSSIEEYWNDWYGSQESRLEDCGKKLIALEESLRDLEKKSPLESRKKHGGTPAIKLELGY